MKYDIMSKDVRMYHIEDDMKKIQVKTNLYLQQYGDQGIFHLAREIIQNSIDELEDIMSGGKRIIIQYDHKTDKLVVIDDGRGIPETDYPIDIACTKLQAGSKFLRSQGGTSSGEFGVGLTVVCALSSLFILATYRADENYMHEITFENGIKTNDVKRKLNKTDIKHGTRTEFIANQKYLGAGSKMPFDDMFNWIKMMTYLISSKITFVIEEYELGKLIKTHTLKRQPFANMMSEFIANEEELLVPVTSFSDKGKIEEKISESTITGDQVNVVESVVKKDVNLDFAFCYEKTPDTVLDSYCNFTKTTDGGVHLDSVLDTYCRFIQNKTKERMTDKEKEKWTVTWNDVKTGLVMLVNLSTNAQVQFMGNAKTKIQNTKLKPVIEQITLDNLTKYFDKHEEELNKICKLVKLNTRARIESQKIKTASTTEKLDHFKDFMIPNYVKCNNTGKQYKEIYLIEGARSASGSVVNGRNPYTQAVYGFRGCVANPFKCSFSDIMQNQEWKNYVKVLRCGIGPTFNINKLYFDKIIIGTDADVDGYYIGAGICGFHALYLPEIITEGHLYKVFSPLYKIDDKDTPFVGNKGELTEVFLKKVVKSYKIKLVGEKDPMTKDELYDFLLDTINYRVSLIRLSKYYNVDKYVVEMIAALLITMGVTAGHLKDALNSQSFITTFMSKIQKKFPEIKLSGTNSIRGVANGRFMSIQLNERFMKKLDEFIDIYMQYGYELIVKEKGGEESKMTIGEFLETSYKLTPKIITRYKGLGEANPEQLAETTLNPDNRILVQFTMDDCVKAMKIFEKLQGNKAADKAARKLMMSEYKIDRDDLDN